MKERLSRTKIEIEMMNMSFKIYLIENQLTNEEFVKKCNKKLKEALSAEDTENI